MQVIKGLDQGIMGGGGVPPMQVGKILKQKGVSSYMVFPLHATIF